VLCNLVIYSRKPHFDTFAYTLRGRSRACATPIGSSPGAGSPNGKEIERAKSADNAKVPVGYTNFGRIFREFCSSDFAQIFRVPRGGGPLSSGEENPKSDEGVSRKSGPKYTPVENFNPPYLPQMGGDPPKQNLFLLGSPGLQSAMAS